jgi:ribonuclease BN (tRNA processing enzyme)
VARYGGNTSCVVVDVPGEPPLLCDLGTGARVYGESGQAPEPFTGTALLTHLHWDHILGLPFFGPTLRAGASLTLVGPSREPGGFAAGLTRAVSPPLFPVGLETLHGEFTVQEVWDETFAIGSAQIRAFPVPHIGPTLGYRIEREQASVAYVSDHQQPLDGSLEVADDVVANLKGVDVLIHDAQYDNDEFARRADWGHCSVDFAVEVARRSEARRLVLYHHDPAHDDAWIDRAVERGSALAPAGLEVVAASEGLRLRSGDPAAAG